MSNSQEIALMQYSPDHLRDALSFDLGADTYDSDGYLVKADELELATARWLNPGGEFEKTFRRDLERFFGYLRAFIDMKRYDGALGLLNQFPKLFHPAGKQICGGAIKWCRNTLGDHSCDTPFGTVDVIICPACNAPRRLCESKIKYLGRCPNHGGHSPSGILFRDKSNKGRLALYERNLSGKMQKAYIEAVTDPDFLSVAPEIAALSMRFAELLAELGESDYTIIATRMQQGLRALRKGVDDKDGPKILEAAARIDDTLRDVSTDRKRWDEMGLLSGRLGRLAETERKRIVEAQQMISVTEMYLLQQEMLEKVRDSSSDAAMYVYNMAVNGGLEKLTPQKIRRKFLLTLHDGMEGKKVPAKIINQSNFDDDEEE